MKKHPDRLVLAILRTFKRMDPAETEVFIQASGVPEDYVYKAGLRGRDCDRTTEAAAVLAREVRMLSHRSRDLERELRRAIRRLQLKTR